jgi:hypothetical protein
MHHCLQFQEWVKNREQDGIETVEYTASSRKIPPKILIAIMSSLMHHALQSTYKCQGLLLFHFISIPLNGFGIRPTPPRTFPRVVSRNFFVRHIKKIWIKCNFHLTIFLLSFIKKSYYTYVHVSFDSTLVPLISHLISSMLCLASMPHVSRCRKCRFK